MVRMVVNILARVSSSKLVTERMMVCLRKRGVILLLVAAIP